MSKGSTTHDMSMSMMLWGYAQTSEFDGMNRGLKCPEATQAFCKAFKTKKICQPSSKAFLLCDSPAAASIQEQYCESLPPVTNHTGPQCNASVDLIGTCWPRSAVGQLVARPCPEYFYGVRYNTTNNGYRECLANGSWAARVNYSQCQEILSEEVGVWESLRSWQEGKRQKKSKLHYHIAVIINYLGHCVSLGALLVAFVLFMRLRSIRCLRNIIHWNLITAFILRNATWFVVQLTMSPEVHESNVVWCRLVTAAYNYFHVTNFFWMFGEGCYLHTAIVLTYSTDKLRKWMFICIGWCIPFPIIVAWAIGKLYYDNEKCWFGKRAGVYTDYIYQGPMILVLLINFIFLFNIVRILMTKLRASTTSETIQYRKAVKATLVLLPLLGITYMLFFVNPGEDEISRIVFIYFNSFLESFQGFFVSVFYCFLNSESMEVALHKAIHTISSKRIPHGFSRQVPSGLEKVFQVFSLARICAFIPLSNHPALCKYPYFQGQDHPVPRHISRRVYGWYLQQSGAVIPHRQTTHNGLVVTSFGLFLDTEPCCTFPGRRMLASFVMKTAFGKADDPVVLQPVGSPDLCLQL
ncbi:hypothetical protein DUI87_28449 [Hirundo rustica rustica]|uniref:Corticotropin-releasing factor receptor 1 n=1 Tax=Hirundo rustica rustica TaxID=333673 RepID=A0A3M0J2H3_HIRRU|nr:hypothetical protein DUI87_28449 [Hirundo rustica rustica]